MNKRIVIDSGIRHGKPIINGTRNGSELVISQEHKVFVNYKNSKSSGRSLTTFPSRSSGEYCFNNLEIASFCDSKSFGRILNSQIPMCLEEITGVSRKSASLVINNLCSLTADFKTSPFEMVLGDSLTSCPKSERNENNPLCTFSSNKNFILSRDRNHEISFSDLGGEVQSSTDMTLSQGRVCIKDFISSGFIFEHFKDYRNHDSGPFESGLPMTYFGVNNDIVINFNSHNLNIEQNYLNNTGQTRLKAGNYYYRNSTGQYQQEINDRKYQHSNRKSVYMDDGVLGMERKR